MDLNLFRKALASKLNILIENHRGIKDDYTSFDYSKDEKAEKLTTAEKAQIKAAVSSVPGTYKIELANLDPNSVNAMSFLDLDENLPFVLFLDMIVYKGRKTAAREKKYRVLYNYSLIAREFGTPQYVKTHYMTYQKMVYTERVHPLFIGDLKLLDPYQKSFVKSNISKWKKEFKNKYLPR